MIRGSHFGHVHSPKATSDTIFPFPENITNSIFKCSPDWELSEPMSKNHSRIRPSRRNTMTFVLLVFLITLVISSCDSFSVSSSNRFTSRLPCAFVSLKKESMEERRITGSKIKFFSILLRSKNNDLDDFYAEDLPIFVKGLQQWPLTPPILPNKRSLLQKDETNTIGSSVQFEATNKNKVTPTTTNVPFSSLINVEALLLASGEDIPLASVQDSLRQSSPGDVNTSLQKLGDWNKLMANLQRSIVDLTEGVTGSAGTGIGSAADSILKEATARLEYFVASTSTAVSPAAVQDLIVKASQALAMKDGGLETVANGVVAVAEKIAREQGLDVREAADRARETTKNTADLVTLANGLLVAGYAKGDKGSKKVSGTDKNIVARPLFHNFMSAKMVPLTDYACAVAKAAELGSLSGAIYQTTINSTHQLGHAVVKNGTTADVTWMITDSIGYNEDFAPDDSLSGGREPVFLRTLTIRGFDASDERVDREHVLNEICTADPVLLGNTGIKVHSGLLRLATAIYADVKDCLDLTAPKHKIVINGHSIGGSLSVIILLLLVDERGADYVRNKIARVFTFGSPPVAMLSTQKNLNNGDNLTYIQGTQSDKTNFQYDCDILVTAGLPSSMVYGYVQPWDPIVRLFSAVDPLYPLLGDLGEDGKTLYASGPPRTLRPITRAIIESWEGWPRFRDNFRATVNQNYKPVGIQHILLPEPIRYLSDRLVAVNLQVPDVEGVLRISPDDLLPALQELFPLDVFRISFVPSAIRSFIHHFFPAYGFPIVDYCNKNKPSVVPQKVRDRERKVYVEVMEDIKAKTTTKIKESTGKEIDEVIPITKVDGIGWSPAQWLQLPRNEP